MGILRGIDQDIVEPLLEAVLSSGLETIEVAMNTPNADQIIRKIVDITKEKMMVGAGTVLDMDELALCYIEVHSDHYKYTHLILFYH